MKLNISQFKKVRTEKDHTVLKHPAGHEIKVLHKPLSKDVKKQLDELPHYSEGGSNHLEVPPKDRTKQFNQAASRVDSHVKEELKYNQGGQVGMDAIKKEKYADGGNVDPQKAKEAQESFTGKPAQSQSSSGGGVPASSDAGKSPEEASHRQSVRASFGYANGGSVIEASKLESQYAPEDAAAQGVADADVIGKEIPNVDPNAPITPPAEDTSHAHLAEAVKNLSQKFVPSPSPAPQDAPTAQVQDPGQPQGTLPQQAQADVNLANKAELAGAQNTQQALGQEANIHGQEAQQMQDLRGRYEEIGNNLHHKFDTLSSEVESGKIDPHQWWNSKSTGSKILTAIGMLFAGAGAGVSGHPEMAGEAINKAVDRDIESQKANLQNKNTLLSKYMEMYNSLPQAEAAARLTMNAGIEGLLKQQASKLGSSNAINAAMQSIANRRQSLLPQMEGLAKGQVMSQMYGEMGKGGAQLGGAEEAYQKHMQDMRILNPDLGKDMENKYLPGVGVARVPIPDALREKLTAQADLSNKLARLEVFANEHQGTILDREIVNEGKTLAADAQQAARVAGHQGVYKESDQKFLENMIDPDPTKFFANTRTISKYKTLREQNNSSMKQFFKSYGIKSFGQPSGEGQIATMGGVQYRKVPGGWQRVQ